MKSIQRPRFQTLVRAGIAFAVVSCSSGEGSQGKSTPQGTGGSQSTGGTSTVGPVGTTTQGANAVSTTGQGGQSGVGGSTGTVGTGDPSMGGTTSVSSVGGAGGSGQSGMGGATTTGGTGQGGMGGVGGGQGGSGGSAGDGGTAPTCPKPDGEVCHELFANDNGRHQVIYVNEFDPSKNWTQVTEDASGGNSPRQLEVVDNATASDGRAVMVSVDSGYEEYDFVTHEQLNRVDLGGIGVRGAVRLPDGNTAIAYGDATLRVVTPEGTTVGSECSLPGSGDDTMRVLSRDPETGYIYFGRGVNMFAVTTDCEEQWTATFPDSSSKAYLVLARAGGGAWAATGYPATVIEVDAGGQVLSEVGGLDEHPGVMEFSSGFDLTSSGNVVIANWWGHVSPPPEQGPHVVELNAANEIVWTWGSQTEALQVTNVLLVR